MTRCGYGKDDKNRTVENTSLCKEKNFYKEKKNEINKSHFHGSNIFKNKGV